MRLFFLLLLALLVLLCFYAPVTAQRGGGGRGGAAASQWNTFSGNRPIVVARGGFSGLFPDSSDLAYRLGAAVNLDGGLLWCDVQITKDEVGICLPSINMENSTDIRFILSPLYRNSTYNVNGRQVTGWFSSDYNWNQLANNVTLIQGRFSRAPNFDTLSPINTINSLQTYNQSVWLNVQHALFYSQQKLNVTKVVLSAISRIKIGYISSPEVSFLQRVAPLLRRTSTKLIFRFPSQDSVDPSSNQSYNSIMKNLTFVKTFASGILVPKIYIWPSSNDDYLGAQPTTVVGDARKAGLEVFVSDFQNDDIIPYNYSYNPVAEYLNYIKLGSLSVDGFVSDFPASASQAIACFSHLDGNTPKTGKPTIISHNGASGDYPGCTDMAYQKAVQDGADYIDCPVQLTKDGILICMDSPNLLSTTTVSNSAFGTRFSTFPEFQEPTGIYTFNFTWPEIKSNMSPSISSPQYQDYKMLRNPLHKNDGSFMSLDDFLQFALNNTSSSLKGVVITIEYAAFLAEKLGFNVTDSVITALNRAGFDGSTRLEVMIKSTNSSTLIPFRGQTKYKILYKLDELISNVDSATLADIKKFADAVAVRRQTIFPTTNAFVTTQTNLVKKLQSANLTVYSYLFMNEFVTPPWDFFTDPIIEIHNHVAAGGVDGVITDFPASADLYRRNTCQREGYIIPIVQPGLLISVMNSIGGALPPALAPFPSLTESDVSESPLPPALKPSNSSPGTDTSTNSPGSSQSSRRHGVQRSYVIVALLLALVLVIP